MSDREMPFRPGASVSVLGLGVSGAAAARLATARGAIVYASDAFAGVEQQAAAESLAADGISAEAGQHDMNRILDSDLVVVSPGISPFSEVRQEISAAGIRTIAEVELAYGALRSRVIGITGTNGKTTTTKLAANLLRESGTSAVAGGNIGEPLSWTAIEPEQPDWVVVELSSFQLADLEHFRVDIGALLNLAPDHLDRYRDLEAYYADKQKLFATGDSSTTWVLNADDSAVLDLAETVSEGAFLFSLDGPVERGGWLSDDGILVGNIDGTDERWMLASDLPLLGSHNVSNALAAAIVARLAGCPAAAVGTGLRMECDLPHRLEPVGEMDGVLWINDSKATNVAAATAAVLSFDRPIIMMLGGRHKGEPYASIARAGKGRFKAIVAFGEAAPTIVAEMEDLAPYISVENGMDAAVRSAARHAEPGDVVLFSPACSSFDMYPNYEARGEAFIRAVRAIPRVDGSS
ncbi:MAG: UDP-N-acetylmuramoyl-L-alanine--D-glutamate ligase [Gemmatimonadota bacterium]